MIIKTLVVGPFEVNNYLVIDEETKEAVLIDAGGNFEATKKVLDENEAKLKCILNTHGHLDHIAGDQEIQEKLGVKVLCHKADEFLVSALKQHLAHYGMPEYEIPRIDIFVEDEQEIVAGNMRFKVIHTPGHSPGAVCYLIDNVLFSGDTLFADAVGRTDLPGGSYDELKNSIQQKLFTLDDDIVVYPGHGSETTIGYEKAENPFFGAKASM